ncbi:hypothetical protein, conserved [Eimeria acervulina]|uniref:Uncharacterized protein n=1 Tax=Eimeria acervulina TaxID=5801 RepID=U6GNT6_EIMAC|nr:hypothetical protein, conserved [Eimeria acervulina]CDI81881.1 hypothetical protein, conserved [Eimeria acervulina]
MQNVNKYHSLGDRLGVVRLALGSTKRRLQSADAALGVKLLNVPLAELAIHYHETQLFIQEAIGHVANAFAVDPQRVVPLQLRPDEREPTKCTIWTFTIRGIPFHDLLGQMREMFEHSKVAFGEWRFGSRKVELEPLILGVPGVLSNVSLQTPPTVWQRPGLDAEWEQEAELWIKLRDFKWLEELKSSVSQFERRLLKLRDVVASTMKVKDPRALQVAKYYSTSDGTIIRMTPATPDKREHIEQLKKWLLAFESGEVNQKVPEVSEDFWPIRSPKTGRPLSLSIFSSSTTSSTVTPLAHRVIVSRDDYSYETPKGENVKTAFETPLLRFVVESPSSFCAVYLKHAFEPVPATTRGSQVCMWML